MNPKGCLLNLWACPLRMRELHAVMLIAIANNHNLSPTEQYSLFDPNTMRPQSNEKPIATAKRILALMEGTLPLSPALDPLRGIQLVYHRSFLHQCPPLFAQVTDKALSRRVKKSMIRALSHSDADVAELSHRQSARSALDRQRLAASVSLYQDRQRRILSWYDQRTWPQLLSAVRGMWDYSQLHAEARYMRRYWSHVGVATENERRGDTLRLDRRYKQYCQKRGAVSCRLGCGENPSGRALVDIAGAKDMPTQYLTREGSREAASYFARPRGASLLSQASHFRHSATDARSQVRKAVVL